MARTQVQAELIATNAISGTIIADNAITATHIATNSISGVLVQDSGITTTMIAANNVTAAKIVTNAIQTRHIADDQVTGDKLTNNITVAGTLTSTGALTANAGVVVDNITIDGTEIDLSSGNLTLDVAGDIVFDAAGGDNYFATAGTNFLNILNNSNNVQFSAQQQDKDFIFTGNDGGTGITALTLDMSDAGAALFNTDVSITTAGKRYYIPRASDAALTGSLYSPTGNEIRLSGAGSGSGVLSFEPSSGSGVAIHIASDGNVGIGETSPDALLHLKGATATNEASHILFENTQGTKKFAIGAGTSGVTNNNFVVRNVTDSTFPLVITDAGNVGIGTTSPSALLHVKVASRATAYDADNAATWADSIVMNPSGANTSATGIAFYNNGTYHTNAASGIALVKHTASSDYGSDMAFIVRPQSAVAIEGMRLTSAGNVGIGTTSPHTGAKLHIVDGAGTVPTMAAGDLLTIQNNDGTSDNAGFTSIAGTAGISYINFGDSGDKNIGGLNYYHSDNSLRFFANAAQHMRIQSDGIVVISSGYETFVPTIKHTGGTGDLSKLRVINRSGQGAGKGGLLELGGVSDDGVSRSDVFGAIAGLKETSGSSNRQGYLALFTNDGDSIDEQVRVQSNGNVLFGGNLDGTITTGNGVKLNAIGVGEQFLWGNSSSNSSSGYHQYDSSTDAYRFIVGYGGTIYATATSISAISDVRLKENIVDLETGLSEVLALKPRRFDWKNGDATNVAGFIAQEVETVLPDLIGDYKDNNIDDLKSVKMGDMLPTLVKAIQEQQTIIDDLKARVETLEG